MWGVIARGSNQKCSAHLILYRIRTQAGRAELGGNRLICWIGRSSGRFPVTVIRVAGVPVIMAALVREAHTPH